MTKFGICHFLIFVCINPASSNVAPNNFAFIDTTTNSVTFQWDALSDQQANGVVQQYVLTCTERNTSTGVSYIKALYLCNIIATLTGIVHNNYIVVISFMFLHTCVCFNSLQLVLLGQAQEEQLLG